MKIIIQVTPTFQDSDELKTIQHFLSWQQISYTTDITGEALRGTRGKSHIHIIQLGKDDIPIVGFDGFHQFYHWFHTSGLIQC